jgi:preprotein translocase subunit SecD
VRRRAALAVLAALPLASRGAAAEARLVLRGGGRELPLGPREVVSASPAANDYGTWTTTVTLTAAAAAQLAAFTAPLVGQVLEVVFDGEVLVAPKLMEPLTDGVFLVTGLSQIEARRLAAFLRA